MDAARFDTLARVLGVVSSRRVAGRFLALAGLGLAGVLARVNGDAVFAAKKGKKRKPKQKVRLNRFGCVDVGDFCKNDAQCCSNICTGTKDKKRCRAHNTGGGFCQPGQPVELGFCGAGAISAVVCTTSTGAIGHCVKTTGNAAYCEDSVPDESCAPNGRPCTKDKDCQVFCGPQAACIQCPACAANFDGLMTACAGPESDSCVF